MPTDRELVLSLGSVGRAFFGRFDSLRDVQRLAIPPIYSGDSTLISSATASGKTEAVLAPLIARTKAQLTDAIGDIRVLAVAPTRALVNDLHARLEGPIRDIGWTCGRQTSDHQDKLKRPHILITTPESFDSMLVRDSRWDQGTLIGHLLAKVQAVFIDEAHLFDASPRGAQVVWQLGRLRRLREYAQREGWSPSAQIQACAASATVADPLASARRLLGANSTAVHVGGSREIDILDTNSAHAWTRLDQLGTIETVYEHLLFADGTDDLASVVKHVWQAIENPGRDGCRKVLVFVPSRALCDRLSLALADFLKARRTAYVAAHHGSLERGLREAAERSFSQSRDAVLVATTTLEVGVDIGDVDVVALIGAPSDTSSLLQRIGRSGRRNGRVKVLPVVRGAIEGRAMASMLDAACRGTLDPTPPARLWSVFVQQATSHTAQGARRGRRRSDLLDLAQSVWPEPSGPATATRILEELVERDVLTDSGGRLFLGAEWSDRFERAGGDFHNNFESEGQGIPVVDSSTGEVVTHVMHSPAGTTSVALAGRRWNVVDSRGEILLTSAAESTGDAPFRYAARAAPTGRHYAEHLRRGLGYDSEAAPVIEGPNGSLWFHFGGSVIETVLKASIPGLKSVKGLTGLALSGNPSHDALQALSTDGGKLLDTIRNIAESAALPMTLGRYHGLLPPDVKGAVCLSLLDPEELGRWLGSRDLQEPGTGGEAERRLRASLWPDSGS